MNDQLLLARLSSNNRFPLVSVKTVVSLHCFKLITNLQVSLQLSHNPCIYLYAAIVSYSAFKQNINTFTVTQNSSLHLLFYIAS